MPTRTAFPLSPVDAASRRRQHLVLAIILAALVRLVALQWHISHADYQGDFTAYWIAGQAVSHGVSPYTYQPPDAAGNPFYYTGFLYPPLAAVFFTPLARLDFYHAKFVWSALQLVFLLAALGITARLVWPRKWVQGWAGMLAVAAVFPPVLVEFERGQVDCLTFLLVVGGIWAWVVARNYPLAAVLVVIAGLFKLPTLLLLLVPLAFRDVRFLKAAGVALLGAVVLSFLVNGSHLTSEYWLHDLPTIAGITHGPAIVGNPVPSPPTPPGMLPSSQGGPELWPIVSWDGHTYVEKTTFPARGSFASSFMSPIPARLRAIVSDGGYLLAIFAIFFTARAGKQEQHGATRSNTEQELNQVLLAFGMVTVLVCHTLSWLMNYVWLLYAAPVLLIFAWKRQAPRPIQAGLILGTLLNLTWFVPHATGLLYKALDQRFCLGSLLLYLAALAMLFWVRKGMART